MSVSKSLRAPAIRLRGVRHNNLKGFDLDLPLHQLIVVTGLSGSGKSSLAFDTLFAEGQRRYIETFSPYARQFFDRMDKPRVDSIEGIPPAIAIEQRNAVRTTRSTVGTMTEICDYLKVLWPLLAQLHCRQCARPVRKDAPQQVWAILQEATRSGAWRPTEADAPPASAVSGSASSSLGPAIPEVLVTFDLPLSEKLSLDDSLALVAKQGYQRLLVEGRVVRLDDFAAKHATGHRSDPACGAALTIVQDRLRCTEANRARFVEACEQAYHFGKGRLAIHPLAVPRAPSAGATAAAPTGDLELHAAATVLRFSNRLHCASCDLEYREPTPALFSFNHPIGACPTCRGFGRTMTIDYDLALPDRSKSLGAGVVKPWQTGISYECQQDLLKFCQRRRVPTDVPFRELSPEHQRWVIEGDPDYGTDEAHQWPRAWYGIKGYFRWLESKAYKMHVRVLLSRYRSYQSCPDCRGQRFQPEALLYRVQKAERGAGHAERPAQGHPARSLTLADFYALPIRDALGFVESLVTQHEPGPADALGVALGEVRARLGYLVEVGLGYLTLDRPTRTLSGGETERVNLTTCLGTQLVNTLFVLDEPSVGLHPRDTARLVRILEHLRDAGNTVLVVEHEPGVMRAADQIVDLGPGHGESGGQLVFQGTHAQLLADPVSLTGQYLSGRRQISIPPRRPVSFAATHNLPPPASHTDTHCRLILAHASRHNLVDVTVHIPLERFVCVTGVSGSGKTTLIREVLLPALEAKLKSSRTEPATSPAPEDAEAEATADAAVDVPADAASSGQPTSALEGWEHLDRVVLVDQTLLAKTPRSNPIVYLGAFEDIRLLFAQSHQANLLGLSASAFSFNSRMGQCERCRGAGFEKIEMQFLSDVFIRCPDCDGRRYRPHVLTVRLTPPASPAARSTLEPFPTPDSARRTPRSPLLPGVVHRGPSRCHRR